MRLARIVCIVAVAVVAGGIGCSHAMLVNPPKYYKQVVNTKRETIGISKIKSPELMLHEVHKGFLDVVESLYHGKVIREYDMDRPVKGEGVDKIVEISYSDIKFDYNHLKSFFIQWPGFLIFMPAWNGLSYGIVVDGIIKVYDKTGKRLLQSKEFSEKYVANYTEGGRGVADGFGWLFWTAPALVAGLVPSDWDHQMKDDAVKQLRKVFGKGLHFTVMDTLNSISATDKI